MSQEDIFKFLVKECGLSIQQIADLNDVQIKALCSPDKQDPMQELMRGR